MSLRLWRITENVGNENFAAHEHLTLAPPTLTLTPTPTAIPGPATWSMMLFGAMTLVRLGASGARAGASARHKTP